MSLISLPINIRKETHLSFHLSSILQNHLYPWFYEKYVNLIIHGDKEIVIDFIDNKVDDSYHEYMEERVVYKYNDFIDKNNVINYFMDSVKNTFYSFIWIDKYNLCGNEYYHLNHFSHPVLVYGYDDIKNNIHCIDFSFEKGIYKCECPYNEFINAFENGQKYIEYGGSPSTTSETVISYKLKRNINALPFNLDRFLSELHDYIYSEHNCDKDRYLYFNSLNISFGISVYDRIIDVIKNLIKGEHKNYISFKSLSDFSLHKVYIYDRLLYIKEKYDLSTSFINAVEEYKDIVNSLHKAKALNIKYNIFNCQAVASFSFNKVYLEKLINIFYDVKQKEQRLLSIIYDELKKSPVLSNEQNNIISSDQYTLKNVEKDINITIYEPQLLDKIVIVSSDYARQTKEITMDFNQSITVSANQYRISNKYIYEFKPQTINNISIKNADGSLLDASKTDIRIYKLPEYVECNQDLCRLYSCEFINKADGNIQERSFELTGSDPNITYGIEFNADIAKYIYLKYSVDCYSETFFLNNNCDTLIEDYSKMFTISPYNKMEYIIDMSDNHEWKGVIRMVRFDPISYDNISAKGECTIEYLRITGEKPVYNSHKDFCKTQGVNGWTYQIFNNQTTYREMLFDNDDKLWKAVNHENIYITETSQSSCAHIASTRRWTCPADGEYKVKYEITPKSSMKTGQDRFSQFVFRRNHKIIDKCIFNSNSGDVLNYEIELILEIGEVLGFEFYNQNENTVEIIEIQASIIKIKDY